MRCCRRKFLFCIFIWQSRASKGSSGEWSPNVTKILLAWDWGICFFILLYENKHRFEAYACGTVPTNRYSSFLWLVKRRVLVCGVENYPDYTIQLTELVFNQCLKGRGRPLLPDGVLLLLLPSSLLFPSVAPAVGGKQIFPFAPLSSLFCRKSGNYEEASSWTAGASVDVSNQSGLLLNFFVHSLCGVELTTWQARKQEKLTGVVAGEVQPVTVLGRSEALFRRHLQFVNLLWTLLLSSRGQLPLPYGLSKSQELRTAPRWLTT